MRRIVQIILPALLLLLVSYCSFRIYQLEREKRIAKEDVIELSKIKYGLFSVDEWKKILASIIADKVEEFDLSGADRAEMRVKISTFLYKVIGEFEERYYAEKSRSISGIIQGAVASFTGTFNQIKKDIPTFTEQILDFMDEPENREAVREYIIGEMHAYADNTFAKIDYTVHDQIIAKYHYDNRNAAINGLESAIASLDNQIKPYKVALLILVLFCGLFLISLSDITRPAFLLFSLISLVLLMTGVVLPMIEIDARIADMSFTLLGEPISFQDQVLYYKSKSILEVVELMITQQKIDLMFIGFLVFTFSVLFPVAKLCSSILYLYGPGIRSNRLLRFMVFRTGKWSMADVMVIAIFMAYIGFTGIITEQLKQIESLARDLDILTTNKSSLLSGFFAFTSFAILSLLVAHKLLYSFSKKSFEVSS